MGGTDRVFLLDDGLSSGRPGVAIFLWPALSQIMAQRLIINAESLALV